MAALIGRHIAATGTDRAFINVSLTPSTIPKGSTFTGAGHVVARLTSDNGVVVDAITVALALVPVRVA